MFRPYKYTKEIFSTQLVFNVQDAFTILNTLYQIISSYTSRQQYKFC
nr:MAG TPA: hypothetical protein [Caudoviricetes sp.]